MVAPLLAVERHVHGLRERRPALHEVVGEQREHVLLREDDFFVVAGAVLEAEGHPAIHSIGVRRLQQLAMGHDLTGGGSKDEEAAGDSFEESYLDGSSPPR